MKKLLLTLTAVAGLTVASKAQEFGFQKTDFIVEGFINSSNANDKQEEEKVSKFNFNPKFGYFVSDKIAVGLELAVGFSFGNVVAFNSSKVDVDGAKAQNEFTTNINVFDNFFNTAHFGLTFKF